MGFQDNVNVDVRGAAHIAPCTYKTVVLKQNITKQNINVLTQAMLDEYGANTKFVIKWDYVLKSDITIPANCILEFDGGSISGEHTVTGQNTIIEAKQTAILGNTITISGTWNNEVSYIDWFNDINKIKDCITLGRKVVFHKNATYYLDTYAELKNCTVIDGNGSTVILRVTNENAKARFSNYYVFWLENISNVKISNIKFIRNSNIYGVIGLYNAHYVELDNIDINIPEGYSNSSIPFDLYGANSFVNITNCYVNHVDDSVAGGTWIRNFFDTPTENILIQNCTFINKKGDEVLAIWAIAGAMRNVLVDNCCFVCKSGTHNPSHLITIGRASQSDSVFNDNVKINNCTFETETTNTHVVSFGSVGLRNCSIDNCLINIKEDTVNYAQAAIFNNCKFVGNGKTIAFDVRNTFNHCTFSDGSYTFNYDYFYDCILDVITVLFDHTIYIKSSYVYSTSNIIFNVCNKVFNNNFVLSTNDTFIQIKQNCIFDGNICSGVIKMSDGVYTGQYIRNNICDDIILYSYGTTKLENNVIKNKQNKGTFANKPTFDQYLGADFSPWVGFKYFATDLGKYIYVKSVVNYTVTWVDAIGNPVDTVYPKVIGTPTNGNLAKFNSTNIEDAGVAPQS